MDELKMDLNEPERRTRELEEALQFCADLAEEDLRRASLALYAQVPEAVAKDVGAKIEAVLTAYREQAAELEQVKGSRDWLDECEFCEQSIEAGDGTFNVCGRCWNSQFEKHRVELERLRARVKELERPDVSAMVGYETALREVKSCDKCDLCEDHLPIEEQS